MSPSVLLAKGGFSGLIWFAVCFLVISPVHGGTIYENFDNNQYNQDLFFISGQFPPTVTSERLEITIPAEAAGEGLGGYLVANFNLIGNFEAQVDFTLVTTPWPANNGVGVGILYSYDEVSRRAFGSDEVYEAYFDGTEFRVGTEDTTGRLRLTRTDDILEAFYWNNGWQFIGSATKEEFASEGYFAIGGFTFQGEFGHQEATVALDNLMITNQNVPLPPSLLLFGSALLGLAALRRRGLSP